MWLMGPQSMNDIKQMCILVPCFRYQMSCVSLGDRQTNARWAHPINLGCNYICLVKPSSVPTRTNEMHDTSTSAIIALFSTSIIDEEKGSVWSTTCQSRYSWMNAKTIVFKNEDDIWRQSLVVCYWLNEGRVYDGSQTRCLPWMWLPWSHTYRLCLMILITSAEISFNQTSVLLLPHWKYILVNRARWSPTT